MTRLGCNLARLFVGLAGGLVWLGLAGPAAAGIIHVPADQPSIQAGVDAANSGDTVLVSPGFYSAQIVLGLKDITLRSENGPTVTIIDGYWDSGPIVTMYGSAALDGFTIRHGSHGGIATQGDGSPLIENNIVIANGTSLTGGGIYARASGTIVRNNQIRNNSAGQDGGGIYILGGNVQVLHNKLSNNFATYFGGGIDVASIPADGVPTIDGNTIQGGFAGYWGGGIIVGGSSAARIVNNLVTGNRANGLSGGVFWDPSPSLTLIANNTIANNTAADGADLWTYSEPGVLFINNILIGAGSVPVVTCHEGSVSEPAFVFNIVWSSDGGPRWGGVCNDQTGVGNAFVDPLLDPRFHLQPGSPAIDAAGAAAYPVPLPGRDIDFEKRPVDGNGDGVAFSDIGADEFKPPPAR